MGSPHSDEGGIGGTDGNVVRLPRDWLGPRDELIPFGGSRDDELDSAPVSSPPKADDFWSEGSATVQHAWSAPAVADSASLDATADLASDAPPPHALSRATVAVAVWRRTRLRAVAGVAVATAAVVVVAATVAPPAHHAPDARLAGEAAAIGVGHGAKTGSGSHGGGNPAPGTNGSQARFSLDDQLAAAVRSEVRRARVRARAQRAIKARAARARKAREQAAAAQTTPVAARSTAAAPPTTGYVAPYVAPSTPSSVSSDTSSGASGNSSSGPSGAGAPFGPGRLG